MAVAGDPKIRHGIILAKNELAKKYGVVTAETVYSAKKKCPKLVLVKSCYEDYQKYSRIVNNIYLKYTDKVEPFGIDESFLDVTESRALFGTPFEIANKIKEEVKRETGLTISVGVSFNKSLAKLGSDLKKPDAITVIDRENFRSKIYLLPVEMLLFVGKSTKTELNKLRIRTIGDLAAYDRKKLVQKLGKLGATIHDYACGIDYDEVKRYDLIHIPKSISSGKTFSKDLENGEQIYNEIRILADEIAFKLRKNRLKCNTVAISVKDEKFNIRSKQGTISLTSSFDSIANKGIELFDICYNVGKVRAITLSISNLLGAQEEYQISIFDDVNMDQNDIKKDIVLEVMDDIREQYGYDKTKFGSLLKNNIDK